MLLYVAATLVLTGMQNYQVIDPTAGFASAFNSVALPVIATIISVSAVLSILTVMVTFLLGVTRVWFPIGRDGLLPGWFSKTGRHGTPQRVIWTAGVASALLAGVFPIKAVADLTNIGILAAFVVVCFAVIVFRYRKPDAPRTFRLPLMPLVPAFGVLARPTALPHLPQIHAQRVLGWRASRANPPSHPVREGLLFCRGTWGRVALGGAGSGEDPESAAVPTGAYHSGFLISIARKTSL